MYQNLVVENSIQYLEEIVYINNFFNFLDLYDFEILNYNFVEIEKLFSYLVLIFFNLNIIYSMVCFRKIKKYSFEIKIFIESFDIKLVKGK